MHINNKSTAKTNLFVALLITGLASASAIALASEDENWSGSYVGANAGYTWGRSEFETRNSEYSYFSSGTGTVNSSGFTGGVQSGYNWQWDSFVFGIEADFNSFDTESTRQITGYNTTIDQTLKTDWLFTARPRVGYATENLLLYVTGGLAVTRLQIEGTVHDYYGGSENMSDWAETQAGWVFGGGLEYLVTEELSFKGEYLYANFGNVENTLTYDYGSTLYNDTINPSSSIVRVGINYHF